MPVIVLRISKAEVSLVSGRVDDIQVYNYRHVLFSEIIHYIPSNVQISGYDEWKSRNFHSESASVFYFFAARSFLSDGPIRRVPCK